MLVKSLRIVPLFLFATMMSLESAYAQQVPDALGSLSETLDGSIDGVTGAIDETVSDISGDITGEIGGVTDTIDQSIGGITNTIDQTIGGVTGTIDETIGGVTDTIDNTIGGITSDIGGVTGTVDENLGGVTDVIGGSSGIGGIIGGGGGGNVDVTLSPSKQAEQSASITGATFERLIPRLSESIKQTIAIQAGVLGIPDFSTSQASFQQVILASTENGAADGDIQSGDRFNANPFGLAESLTGEVNRISTRSVAAAILSEQGQLETQQEAEATQETLDSIVGQAQAAQSLDVTQDVMKNLAALEAQAAALDAAQVYHDQRLEQQIAANNVVSADISEELSEQNRANRAQNFGAAAMLIRASSQTYIPGEADD